MPFKGKIFNRSLSDNKFPFFLMKVANVCPIFKKGDSTSKENYRPIGSKIFERIKFNQIYNYISVNCSLCFVDSEKVIAHKTLYHEKKVRSSSRINLRPVAFQYLHNRYFSAFEQKQLMQLCR